MSEPKLMSNNDYILGDSLKPMTQEIIMKYIIIVQNVHHPLK